MLKSMTGFGRGEGETTMGRVFVESRSVNHRYCEISIKVPKRLVPFETRMKELIRSEVSRGRIDVVLRLDQSGEGKVQFQVDLPLAQQYFQALQTLKEKLGLKDDITLDLLAGTKDLIAAKEDLEDVEPYWKEILPILKQALRNLDEMKRSEGATLVKDLHQRTERIIQYMEEVKRQFPSRLEAYRDRLYERLRSLLTGLEVDPSRFQQEMGFLAERTDITEEIVRAESHLTHLTALLKGEDPAGRKMDFLVQEINREVNTISSKANDAEISQRMVEIKGELEKIREQVQNIE
jgi:uncharacterized protein (TIGR00255 family)